MSYKRRNTVIPFSIQLQWPKPISLGPNERARFTHDQFGLIADSVDCDELHLK